METTYIYSLSEPQSESVRYIGKSNNPLIRYSNHFRKSNRVCLQKEEWIKFLINNGQKPKLEILDEVPMQEWQFWEKHYISLYKSWGFDLLNVTSGGGHDSTGYKHSSDTKKRLSEIRKKLFENPEFRKKQSEWKKGKKQSARAIEKRRETAIKRGGYHKNPVCQLDKNMNVVNRFISVMAASRETGLPYSLIYGIAKYKYSSDSDFIWRFDSDYDCNEKPPLSLKQKRSIASKLRLKKHPYILEKLNTGYLFAMSEECRKKINETRKRNISNRPPKIKPPIIDTRRPIVQLDFEMNLICRYESSHDAGRKTGYCYKKIHACASGKQKTSKGFIWKFEADYNK